MKKSILVLICFIIFISLNKVYAFPSLFSKKQNNLESKQENIESARAIELESHNFFQLTRKIIYISDKMKVTCKHLENNIKDYKKILDIYNNQKSELNEVYKNLNLSMKKIDNFFKKEIKNDKLEEIVDLEKLMGL